MKVYQFIKSNIGIILLGILASVITIYPQIYFEYKLGNSYRGVYRAINGDELYYLARGQDVLDGHSTLGNPYIYELKNKPPIQFFLPDYISAKGLAWTGLNIEQMYFVYDILWPFVLTLLTYLSLFYLTKSKSWAVWGTVYLFFGLFFFYFNRPISPQLISIFFLSLFIFLTLFIQSDGRNKKYLLLSIINFGLLFYVYTYFWTYYFVIIAISAVVFFLKKEKRLASGLLSVLIGGLFFGSYYFYSSFSATKLPEYWDTLTRLGMIFSHFPSGIIIVVLGLLVFLLYFVLWQKEILSDRLNIFILSGVIAGMIVVNQHVITGKNLEFTLHYYLPVIYWYVFAIIFALANSKISQSLKVSIFIASYLVIVFVTAAGNQMYMNPVKYFNFFSKISEEEIYPEKYADTFDWLNKNTNKDDVVFADETLSEYVPAYTHDNVFFARFANLHFMTDEEIFRRFYIASIFNNFNKQYVADNYKSLYGVRFLDKYGHDLQINKVRKYLGLGPVKADFLPDGAINQVLDVVSDMRNKKPVDLFSIYRINFFVWDKAKDTNWDLDKLSFLNIVYQSGDIAIYKFNK